MEFRAGTRFGEARAVHVVAARVTNDVADAFKLR
jgi:hypothetical protein